MKIINQTQPFGWVKEMTCTGHGNGNKGCGSVLEVNRDDLRFFKGVSGDSWGSSDPAVMFKCMVCGDVTDVKSSDWPRAHQKLTPWSKDWQDEEV